MTSSNPSFANIANSFALFLTIISLSFLSTDIARAQSVSVDMILQPQLTKAEVLSLSSLGVDRSGSGIPLFNLVIDNGSGQTQESLYLEVELSSNKAGGRVVHIYQRNSYPFHMDPGQRIVANNNQLQDGLPGIDEQIQFDGNLTSEGREFINDLEGSIPLPSDIYTVRLSIWQGGNSLSGGQMLDSIEETFGANISSESNIDLYLMMPGGEVGSESIITSALPVFRWEGPVNLNYRLIVVEDNGQSPETLLQSALGTVPFLMGSGSRLDYEIIDARLNNSTFTMPSSGVPDLEPGNKYYWQVFTIRESVNTTQSTPSEIWEFTLAADETSPFSQLDEETRTSLNTLLGAQQFRQLAQQGMDFNSITIDGQTFQGAAAIQKLKEIISQIENGEIEIVNN